VERIVSDSFIRVVLTIISILSVVALVIRVWLYTFWMEYRNPNVIAVKFMEMQEATRAAERDNQVSDENG
jgi:hypothetical protein